MNKLTVPGLLLLCLSVGIAQADEEPELAEYMSSLQYFAHKTGLAVDRENRPLAAFYAHELEEVIEEIEEFEEYDGYPIGALVDSKLIPVFEKFESALDAEGWNIVSSRFDSLLDACNDCHGETAHGFISIRRTSDNPFMQDFAPASD